MPQSNTPPGLDSVRSGLAPFGAEALAIHDLMTAARSIEHSCDGPTQQALTLMHAHWVSRSEELKRATLSALFTAALLEASRG